MNDDYLPQQDLDAEQAVIGAVLFDVTALDDAAEVITPEDFYQPKHEAIFRAALALQSKREPVDVLTVAAELERTGELNRVGGTVYMQTCVGAVPSYASAGQYAAIVADKATRRRLDQALRSIQGAAAEGIGSTDDLLAKAEELIGQVSAGRNRVEVKALSQTLEQTLEMLDSDGPAFINTPWPDLDTHIHGWRPGALHVIGARPGGGKSLMGLQAALGMARTGKAVTYAVMEMDTDELNVRLLAQSTEVGMDSLSKRRLTEMEWQKISAKVPELSGLPLYVDDLPRQTFAHIRAHARHVSRRAELGMIVVDYIQQVQTPEHLLRNPRHEQIAHTTSNLKALAREMNVPILAMAQVNRAGSGRIDKAPRMEDLRESGSIEADSDVILLLDRADDDPELNCYVRKARQGQQGHFKLSWHGHFARVMSHSDPYGRHTA